MKTLTSLLLFLFLLPGFLVKAQECPMYFPDEIGTLREMKSYDRRDRLTAISRHEILDKITGENSTQVKVRATSYDEDENEIHTGDLEFICEDGIFRFDLKDYLDPGSMAAYEEMGIEISGDNLVYPATLNAGDQLPDGEIQMVVKSGAATLITITINISNRQVEEKEEITTEAGTFLCHKISYDITSRAGFITTNASATEWIAEGVGQVRTETYNRRGRLTGYSVLTGLQ